MVVYNSSILSLVLFCKRPSQILFYELEKAPVRLLEFQGCRALKGGCQFQVPKVGKVR